MFAPAATACRIASEPEWYHVPSPRFWKTCLPPFQRWPTATGTPSAPICANPISLRPIQPDMTWQPMPLAATDPSGTLVEVLCGQPEQK